MISPCPSLIYQPRKRERRLEGMQNTKSIFYSLMGPNKSLLLVDVQTTSHEPCEIKHSILSQHVERERELCNIGLSLLPVAPASVPQPPGIPVPCSPPTGCTLSHCRPAGESASQSSSCSGRCSDACAAVSAGRACLCFCFFF